MTRLDHPMLVMSKLRFTSILVASTFLAVSGFAQNSNAGGPFVSYDQQQPGRTHHITVADLPAPYASPSVDNGSRVMRRPDNAWPQAPAGFKVELYADGLTNPRLLRTAPNGDVFLAESRSGEIKIFRGITA